MWLLENRTPFRADRAFVRDRDGAEVWVVSVKATYAILNNGQLSLSEDPANVALAPTYSGDFGQSSLLYDSDLLLTKPGTDILLHASAYAPEEKPVTDLLVKLRIGKINKTLSVTGDRFWKRGAWGMKISDPRPFVTIPIVYERAYGGVDRQAAEAKPEKQGQDTWDARNPVGIGFASRSEHLDGQLLPNIEYPRETLTSWKQRPKPASFGPIPSHWSPRLELAGTYDANWEKTRQPLLPADFNDHFFHSAPKDQQSSYLRGGEKVELHNLTPDSKLTFRLPKITLGFTTYMDGSSFDHRAQLYTLIIEPSKRRLVMVWTTHLNCQNKEHTLDRTLIVLKQRRRL